MGRVLTLVNAFAFGEVGACNYRVMDLAQARLVTSPHGLALLNSLPPYDESEVLRLGQGLRDSGESPALVASVMSQSLLRKKAQEKFGEFADGMLFTTAGLEQATRLTVAARHAARFRDAGVHAVADITCGIGADAMAMSAIGVAVMAFEQDEPTALLADHNLRHWESTVVVHADSMATVRGARVDGVFADPARRTAAGRRHRPSDYSPPLGAVLELRDQYPALGVKVGPGVPHDALPPDAEAQWVSVAGDVVEVTLWCGQLAKEHGRGALVIDSDGAHAIHDSGVTVSAGPLRDYVLEPDGAVIRAGLVADAANAIGGNLLDSSIAYITSDTRPVTPFGRAFRVLDHMPYGVKRLNAYLRERNVGSLTIKKRGTAVTPERLRGELSLKGDGGATVILTRLAGKKVVLVVEPI